MGLSRVGIFCLLMLSTFLPAAAQSSENFSTLLTQQVKSGKLSPRHLKDYVTDGKLRLRLQDAVLPGTRKQQQHSHRGNAGRGAEVFPAWRLQALRSSRPKQRNINRYSFSGYSQLQGVGDCEQRCPEHAQSDLPGELHADLRNRNEHIRQSLHQQILPTATSTFLILISTQGQSAVHAAPLAQRRPLCQYRAPHHCATSSKTIARQLCGAGQRRHPASHHAILDRGAGARKLRCPAQVS
jgi:hypothetical protein